MAEKRQWNKKQKTLLIVGVLLLLLVAFRLVLPYIVLRYANKTLATMDGYRGHVNDINLAIIRGAYQLDSIYLNKYDSATQKETPFFGAQVIDLSIEWRSLLKGALVGELVFHQPTLRFTNKKVEPKEVKKDSSDFNQLLKDFMPLKVNRFEVIDGVVQYIDEYAKPRVDVSLNNADIVATNLRNSYDSSALLPAAIKGNAEVYGGTLDVDIKLNPLAEVPTFDLTAEIKNTNLVRLNDFFQAYAKVDVNKGTFGLYTEVAAKDGGFSGYVKPIIKDIDVLGKDDREDNVFKQMWEGVVGTVGQVFENIPKDQVATKVKFEGDVDSPDASVWYAILQILQNAFIQALQPTIDHEISIASVGAENKEKKNFMERIFDKEDKDDKSAKEKEKEKKKGKEKS